MKRWAEPNNMIAESKPTNNIDPSNTETANRWMYVLPAQAASRDQFWRKMRHWQIKWSSSEAYPAAVKWNKFPKHMRDRLKLWEMVHPSYLNSERTIMFNAIILINIIAIITHCSLSSYSRCLVIHFYISCSLVSHHEPADDLLIWTQPPNNLHNCFITLSLLPMMSQASES